MQFQCVNQRGAAECGAVAVRVLARDRGAGPGFDLLAGLPKPDPPPLAVAQGDASQIIHTSGTTSRPKGAVLGHHGGVVQGTLLAQPALETDARHGVRTAFYALPTSDAEWGAIEARFEARFGVRLIEVYGRSKTFGDLHGEPGFVPGDQAALHRAAGAGAAGPGGG